MVKIVIDSAADLAPEIKEKMTVVPMTIRFGNEEFIDGVTINGKQFYEKLIDGKVMPSTSQPTPDDFMRVMQQITDAGDEAVVITITHKMSGTYQSANIAAAEFPGKVFVVDSQTVTIGEGILAELALSLAESGMSASDIAERLCKERENIEIIALLDTLEYLKRGGRISKTAAIAGGLLSIKPVISVFDGEIKVLGKARGSKQGNNLLVQQIESNGGIDFSKPLMLGYTGFSQARLQEYIDDSTALWKNGVSSLRCAQIGSTVGTHAGPGAIAAAFFKKS